MKPNAERFAVCVLVGLTLWVSESWARGPACRMNAMRREQYNESLRKGQQLYYAKKYTEAVAEWQKSIGVCAIAENYYNLALSLREKLRMEQAGDWSEVKTSVRQCLDRSPKPNLQKQCQTLLSKTQCHLDIAAMGMAQDWANVKAAAQQCLETDPNCRETWNRSIHEANLHLAAPVVKAEPPAPKAIVTVGPTAVPKISQPKTLAPDTVVNEASAPRFVAAKWTTGAMGLALFAAGGVAYGLGQADYNRVNAANKPDGSHPMTQQDGDELVKSGWQKKGVGIAGFSVGGAALATAVVLFVLDALPAKPRAAEPAEHAGVMPVPSAYVGPDGHAGLSIQGSF